MHLRGNRPLSGSHQLLANHQITPVKSHVHGTGALCFGPGHCIQPGRTQTGHCKLWRYAPVGHVHRRMPQDATAGRCWPQCRLLAVGQRSRGQWQACVRSEKQWCPLRPGVACVQTCIESPGFLPYGPPIGFLPNGPPIGFLPYGPPSAFCLMAPHRLFSSPLILEPG